MASHEGSLFFELHPFVSGYSSSCDFKPLIPVFFEEGCSSCVNLTGKFICIYGSAENSSFDSSVSRNLGYLYGFVKNGYLKVMRTFHVCCASLIKASESIEDLSG